MSSERDGDGDGHRQNGGERVEIAAFQLDVGALDLMVSAHEFAAALELVEACARSGEDCHQRGAVVGYQLPPHLELRFGSAVDGAPAVARDDRLAVGRNDAERDQIRIEGKNRVELLLDRRRVLEQRSRTQGFAGRNGVGLITHSFLESARQILVNAESVIEMLAELRRERLGEGAIDQRAREIDRYDERDDGHEPNSEREAAFRSAE